MFSFYLLELTLLSKKKPKLKKVKHASIWKDMTVIELLEEYFATPVGWTVEGMSRDPRLDPIRDHPGWLALVEKYARQ